MDYRLTSKHIDKGEFNSHENSKVSTIGYIPVSKQVEMFTLAGKNLRAFREGAFDFDDGVDDGRIPDPTSEYGFDLSDVSYLANGLSERLTEHSSSCEVKNEVNEVSEVKNSND